MNVASLELCKELYELSGWKDAKYVYWSNGALGSVDSWTFDKPDRTPAYDLGYLLQKLPKLVALPNVDTGGFLFIDIKKYRNGIRWRAGYHDQKLVNADTPEDAAAKLAIELFKQGILTKI